VDANDLAGQGVGALAVALLVGTLLVGLLSWWRARRIALPVARLEVAASQLAAGANPALLPESGPRELADLASHFNYMAIQVRELIDGAPEASRRPKSWVAQARPPEQTTPIPTESKPRWSRLARCPSERIQPRWSWEPILG